MRIIPCNSKFVTLATLSLFFCKPQFIWSSCLSLDQLKSEIFPLYVLANRNLKFEILVILQTGIWNLTFFSYKIFLFCSESMYFWISLINQNFSRPAKFKIFLLPQFKIRKFFFYSFKNHTLWKESLKFFHFREQVEIWKFSFFTNCNLQFFSWNNNIFLCNSKFLSLIKSENNFIWLAI